MEQRNGQTKTEYLHTTKVHSWLVLGAVLVLLTVFLLWMFTGNMLDLQRVKVFSTEEGVYGYVSAESGRPALLRKGMEVSFENEGVGTITHVDQYVYTYAELAERYHPTVVDQMEADRFGILFSIDTETSFPADTVLDAWVIMDEITPFQLWITGASQ